MKYGKLLQLPGSEIWNGLEALQAQGVTPSLWHRLRLDKDFGKFAVEELARRHGNDPGRSTVVEGFHYETPRSELLAALRQDFRVCYPGGAIEMLEPRGSHGPAHAVDILFCLVRPFRMLRLEEIETEFAERKVRPAHTEEMLRFCQTRFAADTFGLSDGPLCIVALNAYSDVDPYSGSDAPRHYLCLHRGHSGIMEVTFYVPQKSFDGTCAFLGVRP